MSQRDHLQTSSEVDETTAKNEKMNNQYNIPFQPIIIIIGSVILYPVDCADKTINNILILSFLLK